jgi:MFS family permease
MGSSVLLGVGTALVYPTLLAAVSDLSEPVWRGSAVGVYRLWRDSGYAVGGLIAGLIADSLGIPSAIIAVAGLTFLSGILVAKVMAETHSPGSCEAAVEHPPLASAPQSTQGNDHDHQKRERGRTAKRRRGISWALYQVRPPASRRGDAGVVAAEQRLIPKASGAYLKSE